MPKMLIVGVGDGLSAALARRMRAAGWDLVLAARDTAKLDGLRAETGADAVACDATQPHAVAALFEHAGELDAVVYNPSFRTRGALADLNPALVWRSLEVTAFGAFLVAQQAARHMLPKGAGTILLTGASAGVKGYAGSAPFAMGKFALRGLAQSMARELHPQGVHVVHVIIDGAIRGSARPDPGTDATLDPVAIAETYADLLGQPRSCWAWEIAVRPWTETF